MPTVVYKFVADESGLTTKLAGVKVKLDEVDKSAGKAKEGAEDLSKSFGKGKETASAFAEGLSRVSPQLGDVARNASSALGVLKGLASVGGPVGAALAGGAAVAGAAYFKLTGDINKAEQGALDAAQNAIKAQLGMVDGANFVNKALEANEKASLLKREGNWRDFARTYAEIAAKVPGQLGIIGKGTIDWLDKMDKAQAESIQQAEATRDQNIKLAQAALDVAVAKKEEEKETRKVSAAAKAELKEKERLIELTEEYLEQQEDLTRERKRQAGIDRENDRVAGIKAEVRASAELAEALPTGKEQAELNKIAAKETAMAWLNASDQIAGAVGSLFGDSKAAAIATATINAAVAVTKSFATLGFPAGIPAAIGAAAAGAAQVATIARTQPAFHGGGEVTITAQEGEGVVNRAGMSRLGREGLNAINRGMRDVGGRGGAMTITQVDSHRKFDTFYLKSLSRLNSPTRAAIQRVPTGIRPGRRQRL